MQFDLINLEVKLVSQSTRFQNNKPNLIKIFCSDTVSNKVIAKVEFKFSTQVGRNPEVDITDWIEMDSLMSPVYKYSLIPDDWEETQDGKLTIRVTYSDGNIELRTFDYKFTVED